MYMLGISAGASLSAKYMGLYPDQQNIIAYCSISNPYNFARLSFHQSESFWGRIFSGLMADSLKTVVLSQRSNSNFEKLLQERNIESKGLENELGKMKTTWEMDSIFTYKLGGSYFC